MFEIYYIDEDSVFQKIEMVKYGDKETEDLEEIIAAAYKDVIPKKIQKSIEIDIDFLADGSEYFLVMGKKLFLDCYIVGCDEYGWVLLYVENPMATYLVDSVIF